MGATPTKPRRLTVESDDPNNVINISNEVANRLHGREEVRNTPVVSNVIPVPPDGIHGVPIYYYPEPVLTTVQCRQQKQKALEDNDKYWERRMLELQKGHNQMQEILQCEYKKAVEEFEVSKLPSRNEELPCQINKKKVMDCYKMYPKETMRCAKEVQEFSKCVDSHRALRVSSKG